MIHNNSNFTDQDFIMVWNEMDSIEPLTPIIKEVKYTLHEYFDSFYNSLIDVGFNKEEVVNCAREFF